MLLYVLGAVATVVVIIAFFIANLVNKAVVQSIRIMEEANPFMEPVDNGVAVLEAGADYASRMAWAAENGFEPELLADVRATLDGSVLKTAVWKNSYKNTFLASYTAAGKVNCEFVTTLSNESGLTTSNSQDSALLPQRPGHYTQIFDGYDLSTLYEKHEAGLVFLHERKKLAIIDRQIPTIDLITDAVRKQTAYIQTLPLWKHKGTWWYFVRRPRMNNKSVADQFPG